MKAELFVHAGSQDRADGLRRLVAERIDPDLAVEVHNVDTGRMGRNLELGARYAQLMQAAIPPELGLVLGVNSLSFLGERIYLSVYWPMVSGASSYRYGWGTMENFSPDRFGSFFPALAVRERMVLVPRGGGEALATVRGERRLPTALKEDVLEVDFTDEEAVRAALDATGESLASQVQDEVTAWAGFQPTGEFDLLRAARDLEVDPRFLERLMADRLRTVGAPYERLEVRLAPTRLPLGRWTRVVVTVTNASGEDLDGATLTVAGPVEVLPSRVDVTVPAGASVDVPVSLKPVDQGEFPIEVTVLRAQDSPFSRWLRPVALWLESTVS